MMDYNITITIFLMVVLVFTISKILDGIHTIIVNWANNIEENMIDLGKAYKVKYKLERLPSVDRVVFFNNHNGGKMLSLKSPIKVSALWGNSEYMDEYQSLQLDYYYVKTLLEARKNGVYNYNVRSETDGLLRMIYEREQMNFVKIYYVADERHYTSLYSRLFKRNCKVTDMFYISVGTRNNSFSKEELVEIEKYIEELRKLYR